MTDKDGKYISDKIDGAMAWCPITSLDQADAYMNGIWANILIQVKEKIIHLLVNYLLI